MNIIEYRALVAQEKAEAEAKANVQTEQTPTVTTQQTTQTQGEGNQIPVVEGTEGQTQVEQSTTEPQTIEIDGQEYTLDELKRGYMRQSDYTRKTQELARAKQSTAHAEKLYSDLVQNPEIVEQLQEAGVEIANPQELAYQELQARYYDMLLEQEVNRLQDTYEDFDALAVMRFAQENKYDNLEDAFHLMYSRGLIGDHETTEHESSIIDVDALREQIRQEVLQSLQSNVDTGTIISTSAETTPVRDNTPQLSDQERKVARAMRMSEDEYAKWRNKR